MGLEKRVIFRKKFKQEAERVLEAKQNTFKEIRLPEA
jgi:hypothetical protein